MTASDLGCHCADISSGRADRERKSRVRNPDLHPPSPKLVHAGTVRTHLAELRASGLGHREIARHAGLHPNTVRRISSGETSKITPATKDALLAVMPSDRAPSALLDATETLHECEALVEAGWTRAEIARTTGLQWDTVAGIPHRRFVTRATADAIQALYLREFPGVLEDPGDPLAMWRLLLEEQGDQRWREQAECRRLDGTLRDRVNLFFPERGGDIDAPRSVCERCPVTAECREYALLWPNAVGIWGATTGADRRVIRHRRASDDALAS